MDAHIWDWTGIGAGCWLLLMELILIDCIWIVIILELIMRFVNVDPEWRRKVSTSGLRGRR